jgi:BrnA antitoxin of type II toxin-antitoxin system
MRAEYDFSKGKRGAVIPQKGKTRISIFIDNAVLDEFRARAEKAGTGYQTMMNEALRSYPSETDQVVTEKVLRQVLRQEMPEYLKGLTEPSSGRARRAAERSVTPGMAGAPCQRRPTSPACWAAGLFRG